MTSNATSTNHQHDNRGPVQGFSEIGHTVIALEERVRRVSIENLNQLLADTLALRDLYKKHHWQTSGPQFLQLHTLFDKNADAQSELADAIAERVQTLGGVSVAAAHDIAERTLIPRPPRDREAPGDQLRRLLHAHEVVLQEARAMARAATAAGDDGTIDLIVSQIIRAGELQSWFLLEHLRDGGTTSTADRHLPGKDIESGERQGSQDKR